MNKPQSRTRLRFFVVIIPLLLGGNLLFNLVSFSSINTDDLWSLKRLPSNELIDLYEVSSAPIRTEWIYPVIEDFYGGNALYIPADLLDSLDLSVELLQTRGRLVEVIHLESGMELPERDLAFMLSMDTEPLSTKNGDVYHFIGTGEEAGGAVVLIEHESQFFFIPATLLPDLEGGLW